MTENPIPPRLPSGGIVRNAFRTLRLIAGVAVFAMGARLAWMCIQIAKELPHATDWGGLMYFFLPVLVILAASFLISGAGLVYSCFLRKRSP